MRTQHGRPVVCAPGIRFVMNNVASYLAEMARRQPDITAVIQPRGRARNGVIESTNWTFRQLEDRSSRIARGLQSIGITRGVRTALMVPPSLESYALTFALFKTGAVPVMIDPGIGISRLKTCLGQAEPKAFIGIPRAQLARTLLGWARESLETIVTVGRRWGWGGVTLDEVVARGKAGNEEAIQAETHASDTAAILFTSGSTGPPKGVVYTHGIFIAQIEALKTTFGIEPGEIDLATFPLFGLFGPALGTTVVIPEMDATRPGQVDPATIIEEIECFKATMMFGSPALVRRVGMYGQERGVKLPTLRRVLSAGAPANNEALAAFASMLREGVEVFTPYGATEALPVAVIGTDEILGETRAREAEGAGVCVGRPVGDIEIAIIEVSDDPISTWSDGLRVTPGRIGEIAVRGSVVTGEYFGQPDATKRAKIECTDRSVWHRMGDAGYIDDNGRLWFCGRVSQRVVTRDGTLFTVACERIFNAHPLVFRTALVGVLVGRGAVPVLCVELHPGQVDRARVTEELLVLGAARVTTASIRTILYHAKFPVDTRHNAKIQREKLAMWASRFPLSPRERG